MLKIQISMASLLFVFCSLVRPEQKISDQNQLQYNDLVRDILEWFPEDTETITVAQGAFKAEELDLQSEPKDLTQAFRHISVSKFLTLQEGRFYRQIRGQTVLLSVEGSRRFREPTALGGMLTKAAPQFTSNEASWVLGHRLQSHCGAMPKKPQRSRVVR